MRELVLLMFLAFISNLLPQGDMNPTARQKATEKCITLLTGEEDSAYMTMRIKKRCGEIYE